MRSKGAEENNERGEEEETHARRRKGEGIEEEGGSKNKRRGGHTQQQDKEEDEYTHISMKQQANMRGKQNLKYIKRAICICMIYVLVSSTFYVWRTGRKNGGVLERD